MRQRVTVSGASDEDEQDDQALAEHVPSGGDNGANRVTADDVMITVLDQPPPVIPPFIFVSPPARRVTTLSLDPDRVPEDAGPEGRGITVTATLTGPRARSTRS